MSSPAQATVDVRTIPPHDRHPLIFTTFADLGVGQALELVNDHDPKPLYFQFEARVPGRFTWSYLEEGPATWRVRITKLESKGGCCGSCGG